MHTAQALSPVEISAHIRSLPPETFPALPAITEPVSSRDTINLISGGPALEALPTDILAEETSSLFEQLGPAALLSYGSPFGDDRLRDELASRYEVPIERILVTNGALHGTTLALSLLLDRGARVAVENPTFPGTISLFHLNGITPVFLKTRNSTGLDVDDLESRLEAGETIDAVYTIPDCLNPSGAILPRESRARLLDLADRFGFVVIVDNPYREALLDGPPEDDFDFTHERLVYLGAFTKTLGAGLRVGWMIAPAHIVKAAAHLRKRGDFQTSSLAQNLVAGVLQRRNEYHSALERGREAYRTRRAILLEPFLAHPEAVALEPSRGGFFLWPKVVGGEAAAGKLLTEFARAGVIAISGAGFGPGDAHLDRIRLSYSAGSPAQLSEASERIASVLGDGKWR